MRPMRADRGGDSEGPDSGATDGDQADLFRQTFENAAVGMAHVGLDGQWLRVNQRLCEILGYARDELTGKTFQDLTHPDDLDADLELAEQLRLGQIPHYTMDKRYLRPDGTMVWAELTGSIVRHPDGTARYFIAVVEDITVKRRAEEALRDSEQFTRRLLDNLFAFVGVMHPDGTLVQANRAPLDAAGITADDVVGRKFWDCHWWSYDADVQQQLREAVDAANRGRIVRYDVPVRMTGDELMWIDFQLAPLYDAHGRITHLVPSAMDVSARKAAEEVLRESEAAERRARARAELMADVARALESVSGLREQAERLVELLVPRLGDHAVVELANLSPPVLVHAGTAWPEPAHHVSSRLRRLPSERWVDAPLDVGLGADGRLLVATAHPAARPFTHEERAFIAEIAQHAGVLLGRARIREEEHRIALRLQRALLPESLAGHPRLEIAARYQSASANLEVGGDWYDTFILPDGRMGLAVGDVVGHGLEAAASMGRLRTALAALAPRASGPGQLLEELDAFARSHNGVRFATAGCAVLDPATGELRYASAGHPPMLIVDADGTTRWLDEGRSLPLGVLAPAPRSDAHTVLRPGSVLLLYSDGLIERRRQPLDDSLARLADTVRELRHQPVDQLIDGLLDDLVTPLPAEDDVVAVCVRLAPASVPAFRFRFTAGTGELSRVRAAVRDWVGDTGVDASIGDDLLIALGEACANAVEHAYHHRAPGEVDVGITVEPSGDVVAQVRDYGTWRNPADAVVNRGRGTQMMQAVSSDFRRATTADGTTVTFRLPAPRRAALASPVG
jgi:PAS domain S-box-containing protein